MTPLEDKLRRAIQAKASQVPPDAVPPLRLSAGRRRSSSLAHGGGERSGAPVRRGWFAPAASAVLVAALIAGAVAVSHVLGGQRQSPARPVPATPRSEAAAWVAAQVSRSDVVSCDPATCGTLAAAGFPGTSLLTLQPGGPGPLDSQVIVMTAALRASLGAGFSSRYAPAVLASFGSGRAQVEVRVVAPDGAAAYRSQLSTDLAGRTLVTTELLRSPALTVSSAARRQMLAYRVDARLLIIVSYMTTVSRVSILAFGDSGPGAGAGGLLRSAQVTVESRAGRPLGPAGLRRTITFLYQQEPAYVPTRAETVRLPSSRLGLSIEYAAPTPLGMLNYDS